MKSLARDDRTLEPVIGLIYEAAMDPTQWQQVLDRVNGLVSASAGAIYLHDYRGASSGREGLDASFAFVSGIDEPMVMAYAQHYAHCNVWAHNEDAQPPGLAVSSSMLYPDELLPRTEFHGDWLRKLDLFYSLGGVVERRHDLAIKVGLMRAPRAGAYTREEIDLWQRLVPHVQRASRIHMRLAEADRRAADAEEALGSLPGGVLLLDPQGGVASLNAAARGLLSELRGLLLDRAGQLVASGKAQRPLQAAIEFARRSEHGCRLAATPPSPLVRTRGPDGALDVFVSSLPPSLAATGGSSAFGVAVFLSDPDAEPPDLTNALRAVYGLSAAEAAMTAALAGGQTLAEFARDRGVTINTVRTQFRTASAKVGAKRQVDLVRMALTGPAMFLARRRN